MLQGSSFLRTNLYMVKICRNDIDDVGERRAIVHYYDDAVETFAKLELIKRTS